MVSYPARNSHQKMGMRVSHSTQLNCGLNSVQLVQTGSIPQILKSSKKTSTKLLYQQKLLNWLRKGRTDAFKLLLPNSDSTT